MSIVAAAANGHLFWITSRAAGTAALVLSSVSVGVGLLMGGKLLRRRTADLRIAHEALSLATLLAIVVHGAALLGDGFVRSSVLDVTVPFVTGYKTIWTSIGIVAGWSLVLLGLSFYARARIGQARWRSLHRFTALAWALGVVHSLGEGTDAGQTWFLGMTAAVVVPALLLLVRRMWPSAEPRAVAPQPAAPRRPADASRAAD
jgi:sulfoxide reductase heme-binding subunit YedZ